MRAKGGGREEVERGTGGGGERGEGVGRERIVEGERRAGGGEMVLTWLGSPLPAVGEASVTSCRNGSASALDANVKRGAPNQMKD
jgi:hypothetical protein